MPAMPSSDEPVSPRHLPTGIPKTAAARNLAAAQRIEDEDFSSPRDQPSSSREASTRARSMSRAPTLSDARPIHFDDPPSRGKQQTASRPHTAHRSEDRRNRSSGPNSLRQYGTIESVDTHRRSSSPEDYDIEALTVIKRCTLRKIKALLRALAGEQAYIATVMVFTAGTASCMTVSLKDPIQPGNIATAVFPFLLGILNAYCTLFVPAFRDRSSLPKHLELFIGCIAVSIVAYIIAIGLWSSSQLGVNIALDIGSGVQVVAVAVFAHATLEDRKILRGIADEQLKAFDQFNEKKKLEEQLAPQQQNETTSGSRHVKTIAGQRAGEEEEEDEEDGRGYYSYYGLHPGNPYYPHEDDDDVPRPPAAQGQRWNAPAPQSS